MARRHDGAPGDQGRARRGFGGDSGHVLPYCLGCVPPPG
jgi:hypothetical protein